MTLTDLLARLHACPLVASVQASEGSSVDDPETLLKLAQASLDQGVQILRLQGIDNIKRIKGATATPVIGLIKQSYDGSEVYITPTSREVEALSNLGCDVIALDGTSRARPEGESLAQLIGLIHLRGSLAMADCDSLESAHFAQSCGADLIGTTLAGYTQSTKLDRAEPPHAVMEGRVGDSGNPGGPDLELLRQLMSLGMPVIAEGRYSQKWHVDAALRIGAVAVVVGGALNDPVKQTRSLMPTKPFGGTIGAVDIGGTWLRFGIFSHDWRLIDSERILNPPTRTERLAWIKDRAARHGVDAIGVSTGGIVDPQTGICWTAKEYLMPDQIGIEFSQCSLGLPTQAHGDGHATAWGHACLPQFAGRRVATLALGTGVGCGFVESGRIWAGRRGEYPRINDLPTTGGRTFEDLLGGINLTQSPNEEQINMAVQAFEEALFAVRNLYFPDDVVVAGSVGLSEWMVPHLARLGVIPSPFGTDAGLYGAAALALFPPAT